MSATRRRIQRFARRRRAKQAIPSRFPPRASVAAAVVSGGLLAAAFPPLSLWPAGFAAIGLLVLACHGLRPFRGAIVGWIAGAVFYALAFSWVAESISRLPGVSIATALPVFVAFIAWHALPMSLVGAYSASLTSLSAATCAGIAGCWVVVEALFPRVIPWHLGDLLAPVAVLRQGAEIGGTRWLAFLIVFIGACATATAIAPNTQLRIRAAAPALALLVVAFLFGLLRDSGSTSADSLSVLVVQAGSSAGDDSAIDVHNASAWTAYSERTLSAVNAESGPPDLVIWPETTLRLPVLRRPTWRWKLEEFSDELGAPLLIGSLDPDPTGRAEFNSAILFNPAAQVRYRQARPGTPMPKRTEVYHKQVLLPFGEYVPGPTGLFPQWSTTGRFAAGEAAALLPLRSQREPDGAPVSLATSICFEAILPGFFNRAVADGGRLLVNLTDDGWFGPGAEPEQHLNATRLRAVETRRWLVRASGSGISAVVSPSGNVVQSIPYGDVGTIAQRIEPRADVTLYVRFGDAPWIAIGAVLAVATRRKARRRRYSAV